VTGQVFFGFVGEYDEILDGEVNSLAMEEEKFGFGKLLREGFDCGVCGVKGALGVGLHQDKLAIIYFFIKNREESPDD
jgi:hypothetical protein